MATIEEMKQHAITNYACERLNEIFASYSECYERNENLPVISTPRNHVHACEIWQSSQSDKHVSIEIYAGTMSATLMSPRAWEDGDMVTIIGQGGASIHIKTDVVLSWLEYIEKKAEDDN